MTIEPHPFALEVPRPTADDRARLRASIARDGFDTRTPIELYQDKILDGLTRYDELLALGLMPDRAQALSGSHPWFRLFKGTDEQARDLVRRLNYDRRQLTEAQVAMRVAKDLSEGVSAETLGAKKPSLRKAVAAAKAQGLNTSLSSVQRAAKVLEQAPDVAAAVNRGEVPTTKEAVRLAAKPEPERKIELAKSPAARKAEAKAAKAKPEPRRPEAVPRELINTARVRKVSMDLNNDDRRRLDTIMRARRGLGSAPAAIKQALELFAGAIEIGALDALTKAIAAARAGKAIRVDLVATPSPKKKSRR